MRGAPPAVWPGGTPDIVQPSPLTLSAQVDRCTGHECLPVAIFYSTLPIHIVITRSSSPWISWVDRNARPSCFFASGLVMTALWERH